MGGFKLHGKIVWGYKITAKTGLHVGGSSSIYEIGAPDKPVVKDPVTGTPYIPGSSLKGKLRSLLERRYLDLSRVKEYHQARDDRERERIGEELRKDGWAITGSGAKVIYFADCSKKPDLSFICKLFGSPGNTPNSEPSRLIITDAAVDNWAGVYEIKGENALDRVTSAANPRFIERVPPGTVFDGYLIMNVYDVGEVSELVEKLREAFELLARDYLGGHGTRGYGRVEIEIMDPEYYPENLEDRVGNAAKALAGRYAVQSADERLEG